MAYFRSAGDTTQSENSSESQDVSIQDSGSGEEDDHSLSRVRTISSDFAGQDNRSSRVDSSDAFSPSSAPASFHANALLHALLEDRCMARALVELQNKGLNVDSIAHPEVQALGRSKYQQSVQNLEDLNVVKPGIDSQYYSLIRQGYRDAVDVLADQSAAAARPKIHKAASQYQLPQNLRDFQDTSSLKPGDVQSRFGTMTIGGKRENGHSIPSHKVLETKYVREFDEFSMLGKGGYGVVYHVKNKLDGGTYAIKKVPMSDRRIRKIQENGQQEMDVILLELRTLARLNHPNVVRYYSGWIEYATFTNHTPTDRISSRRLLEPPGESSRSEANTPSADIQFQFDDDGDEDDDNFGWGRDSLSGTNAGDMGIIFEDSTDRSNCVEQPSTYLDPHKASLPENALGKMSSRSTLASVDDEEVETIPRSNKNNKNNHNTTNTTSTSTSVTDESAFTDDEISTTGPCLALHIQMSLYSMTLEDFLSPERGDLDSSTISSLRHCFHPSAALTLLLAIINGVRYLHKEGIVHRDLKPGNVFLAVRPGSDCPPGAIDLASCDNCDDMAKARPFNIDVCIGDFGLVSAIAKEGDEALAAPSRIVGTEVYRPESITRDNHPRLAVYALGIIALELFWRFDTKMERHEILRGLKKGQFPEGFENKVGCLGAQSLIESMVLASETDCPSWDSLKNNALGLLKLARD